MTKILKEEYYKHSPLKIPQIEKEAKYYLEVFHYLL